MSRHLKIGGSFYEAGRTSPFLPRGLGHHVSRPVTSC
jgi:hypothetical protein